MKLLPYIFILMWLSGCGGFRGGIESVAYIGGTPPQAGQSHPSWPQEITLPGFTLFLSLNNAVRTYQYEVMLFIIPTYLNFMDEFRNRDAESLELIVQLAAHDFPVTVDPRQLVLTVDGQEVRPSGVWVNNVERERQRLDTYVAARRQAPAGQPPPLPRASEWRDAITDSITVLQGKKSPRFIVNFPLPLVTPEKHLVLNLSPAIVGSAPSHVPPIHFKSMRWSEGYS
ncbi:MAG TPA: hypothetical protein VD738_10345 [Nitrospira sp.]|nr:hypothetical protein [Nitrospira sp.]